MFQHDDSVTLELLKRPRCAPRSGWAFVEGDLLELEQTLASPGAPPPAPLQPVLDRIGLVQPVIYPAVWSERASQTDLADAAATLLAWGPKAENEEEDESFYDAPTLPCIGVEPAPRVVASAPSRARSRAPRALGAVFAAMLVVVGFGFLTSSKVRGHEAPVAPTFLAQL